MTPILEFQHVARAFTRGAPVLADVSFAVAPGEVVGLLGRNGAGKTTLIRIAMGMLFPQSGSVRVFGLSPTDEPVAVKRRIGYVAEDQVLPPGSTVEEMIAFHRYLFPAWDDALAAQLLRRFGLEETRSKIGKLSTGHARQVALLCAVCHRPELLILDEPAGGLDPAARREFLETSIQLLNREGTAILFSSHYMSDVERLGGRVVLIEGGRVVVDRPLDQIREGHCVAMIPRSAVPDGDVLERLPRHVARCLRAHAVFDQWHVVFEGTPDGVRTLLHESLGLKDVQCRSVPLEELFVELVGGERELETVS